ncbi:hypothetical protein FRC05_009565 [Tulasnella sp. 425]|nr:hypothetical protein FRC05_009565 [Tulasnella sp. 425]
MSTKKQPHLDAFLVAPSAGTIEPFSDPLDPEGYNLTSISDDVINSVYGHFANTRVQESEQLLCGITCRVLSFDATYKATKKATLGSKSVPHSKPFETLVTMITEDNLIASWRFTFTEALLEIQAQLRDLCVRLEALGFSPPPQVQEVLPETEVGQDIYHYSISISAVGRDIVSALLSETAATSATGRAQYRPKEEQTKLMEECFRKWQDWGVFTTAVESISLVSECTRLWNAIIQQKKLSYPLINALHFAKTDEHVGLVHPIDGTFGVKSTEDIDYIGFEETLLMEDVVKREFVDDLQTLEDLEDEACSSKASIGGFAERDGDLPSYLRFWVGSLSVPGTTGQPSTQAPAPKKK